MKSRMKKAAVSLIAILLCLGLSACGPFGNFRERENKTATTVCPVEPGRILHVDTQVKEGCIRVEIRDGSGELCFQEELWSSKSCTFPVYLQETYTVTAVWKDAKGQVDVYETRQSFPFF